MTHYLLSIVYPADAVPPTNAELESIMVNVNAFHDELKHEGAWVFGGGLHDPGTATVVDVKNGRTVTTDGPFIESKEVVGGLTIIDAPDLDAALAWAAKASQATTVPVEVRPFMEGSGS